MLFWAPSDNDALHFDRVQTTSGVNIDLEIRYIFGSSGL